MSGPPPLENSPQRGARPGAAGGRAPGACAQRRGAGAANRLWRRERAREICEAEEELEAPKTAVDGLARFAGEQGRKLFTLPRPLPPSLERLRFASSRGPEAATEWVGGICGAELTRRCSRSRFQPQTGNRRRFGAGKTGD